MFKVLKTFGGMKLSAKAGAEVEISDKELAADLLRAGYIEATKAEKPKATKKTK